MILLAAGFSRRFGENKLLYPFEGKELYRHIFDRLCRLTEKSTQYDLRVVTQFEEIRAYAQKQGIPCVWNDHSCEGISSSLKLGVESIEEEGGDCYLFFVADQPYVTEETITGFVRAFSNSGCTLGCVCYGEKRGNPVIFDAAHRRELLELKGDTGGKQLFALHGRDAFYYQAESEVELRDYDIK